MDILKQLEAFRGYNINKTEEDYQGTQKDNPDIIVEVTLWDDEGRRLGPEFGSTLEQAFERALKCKPVKLKR